MGSPAPHRVDRDWWPEPQAKRSPRQALDRDQAVEAAYQLIDEVGLEAFSMRGLAARLGVGAPALYYHVVSREQLLGMVLERALFGFELPDGSQPWTEELVEMAHRWLRHWLEIPDVGALLELSLPPIPTIMRNGEWAAKLLLDAGLARHDAAYALAGWQAFLTGVTTSALRIARRPDTSSATQSMDYVERMLRLETEDFPSLRTLALEYANVHDAEQLYDVALRSLVNGFEQLADVKSSKKRARGA
jgi:AcrR family transcriptional regulator